MEHKEKTYEVTYQCTHCEHTQTLSFFKDQPSLTALCCVNCRAGFGMELGEMVGSGIGMYPVVEKAATRIQ